jgi:hypothetical protein
MPSTLDRLKNDIDILTRRGQDLFLAMKYECFSTTIVRQLTKEFGESKAKEIVQNLPAFAEAYEAWYSEARALVKHLLPDRLQDFISHYEVPKSRRELSADSYRITDYLQGISATNKFTKEKIVGQEAAILHFRQQLAIVKASQARFQSALFDIRHLVQADIFDSELEAAGELAKNKFLRSAGALAGVVLERHLAHVCSERGIKVGKSNPGISDLNDALKQSGLIDIPQWRHVQLLGDIRNLCDHAKSKEPTSTQIEDLLNGTAKVVKTIL